MYYAGAGRRQLGRPRGSFLVEGRHCGSQLLLECQECITFCTALIFDGLEGLLDGCVPRTLSFRYRVPGW